MIDYLQKGKTINFECNCNILDQLYAKIQGEIFALKKQNIFHQGNAHVHTSDLIMAKFKKLKYEFLEHPAYSLGLSSDCVSKPEKNFDWKAFYIKRQC